MSGLKSAGILTFTVKALMQGPRYLQYLSFY